MNKRDANLKLMAHWTQAWTTLGRWQVLNARLSKETAAQDLGWARRSLANYRGRETRVVVSAKAG